MDMCDPPDIDMVAQAILQRAESCRQQLLHAGATVQHTSVQCFRNAPLDEETTSMFACRVAHSTFVGAEYGSIPRQ
jgi:hypothetical protein